MPLTFTWTAWSDEQCKRIDSLADKFICRAETVLKMSYRATLKVPKYRLFYFKSDRTISIVPLKNISKVINGYNVRKGSKVMLEFAGLNVEVKSSEWKVRMLFNFLIKLFPIMFSRRVKQIFHIKCIGNLLINLLPFLFPRTDLHLNLYFQMLSRFFGIFCV